MTKSYAEIKNEALSSSEDNDNTSFRKLGLLTEALLELGNAATGIKNLLLARIERVAARADFEREVLTEGRAGLKSAAAGAGHFDLVVFRVNRGLHDRPSS